MAADAFSVNSGVALAEGSKLLLYGFVLPLGAIKQQPERKPQGKSACQCSCLPPIGFCSLVVPPPCALPVLPLPLGEAAAALQPGGHASHPQEDLQGAL